MKLEIINRGLSKEFYINDTLISIVQCFHNGGLEKEICELEKVVISVIFYPGLCIFKVEERPASLRTMKTIISIPPDNIQHITFSKEAKMIKVEKIGIKIKREYTTEK